DLAVPARAPGSGEDLGMEAHRLHRIEHEVIAVRLGAPLDDLDACVDPGLDDRADIRGVDLEEADVLRQAHDLVPGLLERGRTTRVPAATRGIAVREHAGRAIRPIGHAAEHRVPWILGRISRLPLAEVS